MGQLHERQCGGLRVPRLERGGPRGAPRRPGGGRLPPVVALGLRVRCIALYCIACGRALLCCVMYCVFGLCAQCCVNCLRWRVGRVVVLRACVYSSGGGGGGW